MTYHSIPIGLSWLCSITPCCYHPKILCFRMILFLNQFCLTLEMLLNCFIRNHVDLSHLHQQLASSLLFVLGCGNRARRVQSALLYFYQRPETSQSAALQGPSQLKVIFSFMQWWTPRWVVGLLAPYRLRIRNEAEFKSILEAR